MSQKMESIAIFDFDGTITKNDTLLDIVIYSKGLFRFILGIIVISPAIIANKIRLISRQRLKEIYLEHFFCGISEASFTEMCTEYANNRLPEVIHCRALEKINSHKIMGHQIIIVSASFADWIKPWANNHGIDYVISSVLEKKAGRITGKITGTNCNGPEKLKRVNEQYDLKTRYIYCYGNSRGDKHLLSIADEKYYELFK